MAVCECRSSLHPSDGCRKPALKRWEFPPEHVHKGEPGYIDLCKKCVLEWTSHRLEPLQITLLQAQG